MTRDWRPWAPNDNSEKNRYFDWNDVSGGLHPTWRLRGRDDKLSLDFPEIGCAEVDEALISVSDFFRQAIRVTENDEKQSPEGQQHNLTAADLHPVGDLNQKSLLLILLQSISQQYKSPTLRLPPVPPGSASICDANEGKYACYFTHVVKDGTLPAELEFDLETDDLKDDLKIDKDTVIVGVLDVGIPLGHRETRLPDGSTRILAAWQQTANRRVLGNDPDDKANQFYLPFGREILAHEINEALERHSPQGKKTGFLDEDSFNRELGLEDYTTPFGQRDLGLRASHGAHILSTAAGMSARNENASRARIIAVNMPDRSLIGHSAQFLEYFAVHGIMRIVMLADALWDKLHLEESAENPQGFPIVINLAFGKHAQSRDSFDPLTRLVKQLNELRKTQNRRPVILSLPVGNENLDRGNIRTRLAPGAKVSFDWRIKPEDQSANFVEIWTKHRDLPLCAPSTLALQIEAPGSAPSEFQGARNEQVLDYVEASRVGGRGLLTPGLLARVYCDRLVKGDMDVPNTPSELDDEGKPEDTDQRYLIAVKQTVLNEAVPVAPAGVWRITLQNRGQTALGVVINAQSDQTEQPLLAVNQRSYFERPEYERFDETGRVVDTATYPLDGSSPEVTDSSPVLRRHGTINAIGRTPNAFLVAGHRESDGRMVPYSSTGIQGGDNFGLPQHGSRSEKSGATGAVPLASLPIRTGPAHFGTLAAGTREGSVVAMEGTSFAAAQLTRRVLDLLLGDPDACVADAMKSAAEQEDSAGAFPGQVLPVKAGQGRLQSSGNRGRYRAG